MPEDGDGSLRRLHLLVAAVGGVDPAEAAVERTSDARMVHSRALSEERGTQILLHRDAVVRKPGEVIRPFHRPLAIGTMQPEGILIGKAGDGIERSLSAHCVQ